ncbi:aspartate racemase [Thalassobacillus devorans]|uniref:Aspartate racemase n=1 Tax=Thalassobacillus devorans TaxID=279813 RepID=A0ABQ1NSP0_9BACI|nr:amino acid racemase [Thalassobacillus devorans]NIK28741.1 aspartate racemase [Thalassobacillus devorans]GGC83913.1 aspartate racemase [Thalassobacillus devorans]
MEKTVGIIGGMGPLATVDIFNKIVRMTDAKIDQDHPRVVIDNNPGIPSRQDFFNGIGYSPLPDLIKTAKNLENIGAELLIMPCNTAHYFHRDIAKNVKVPFINMLEETAGYFSENHTDEKKVGLLATTQTCELGIYEHFLSENGVEIVKPSAENQAYLMEIINVYIKQSNMNFNLDKWKEIIDELQEQEVKTVILGCTELSIAFDVHPLEINTIDPTVVLAEAAIKASGKKVLARR